MWTLISGLVVGFALQSLASLCDESRYAKLDLCELRTSLTSSIVSSTTSSRRWKATYADSDCPAPSVQASRTSTYIPKILRVQLPTYEDTVQDRTRHRKLNTDVPSFIFGKKRVSWFEMSVNSSPILPGLSGLTIGTKMSLSNTHLWLRTNWNNEIYEVSNLRPWTK